MKLKDFKDQIDAKFKNLNPTEVIEGFEALGYEFEDTFEDYQIRVKSKVSYINQSKQKTNVNIFESFESSNEMSSYKVEVIVNHTKSNYSKDPNQNKAA